MKERIQKIMELEQLSASKFADTIGVQRSNISHVLNGRNKPSLELVNRILDHFDQINADWLLLGKGHMTTNEKDQINAKGYSFSEDREGTGKSPHPVKIVVLYSDQSFEEFRPKLPSDPV